MEYNVRALPAEQLMQPLLDLMKDVESVPLVISGNSMRPFLVHGRDTVFLSQILTPPKKGDMVLYRRDNGAYILHRVLRRDGERYTMIGDGHTVAEPGIRMDQILARVTAVRRKGTLLRKGSFVWDFFEKIWIRMVPLRPAAEKIWSWIK